MSFKRHALLAPNNHFLSKEIKIAADEFVSALYQLKEFLIYRFFVWPEHQKSENTRFCMQPHLNIDRAGNGSDEQTTLYRKLSHELDDLIKKCYDTREKFISVAHRVLADRAF